MAHVTGGTKDVEGRTDGGAEDGPVHCRAPADVAGRAVDDWPKRIPLCFLMPSRRSMSSSGSSMKCSVSVPTSVLASSDPASLASFTSLTSSRPWLTGSIGEGPNHSNYSDHSSVRILGIRRKLRTNENQNSEKTTNDPLYNKGPQKNREKDSIKDVEK